MLSKISKIGLTLCFIGFVQLGVKAQVTPNGDWMRVQSDDGEFSVELPPNVNFFFEDTGAMPPQNGGGLYLKGMRLLNAYVDQTLISVEFYEERKETLDRFFADDSAEPKGSDFKRTKSEIRKGNNIVRQVIQENNSSYMIRQYFRSKKHIYILTAASRQKETKSMRRFLDSLIFKPDSMEDPDPSIPRLSSLKSSAIDVITKNVKPSSKEEIAKLMESSPGSNFLLLSKARPSYTDNARQSNVQGTIQLRISCSVNGFTPKIEVIKALPQGLLRQAIFAAMRIKFLPEEEFGKSVQVEKVVEYTFTIY
jgi:hypothetical protein